MSNISTAQRVDAAVAALQAYHVARNDADHGLGPMLAESWYLVGILREGDVNRELARKYLDAMLAVELKTHWRTCWVRLHVGEIEEALGLAHDPRSAEALTAARAEDGDAWNVYTRCGLRLADAPKSGAAP